MQLFVLGMHRSGTSGVTRLLNMAGAYFGPEGISNGADAGNPKGFWERLDVRASCDGLLHESGFDWWRLSEFSLDAIPDDVRDRHLAELHKTLLELDAHRPWVLKEPRLCLLLPLLLPRLEVPICIHVTREPLEVAESLRVRNDFPAPAGLALWEMYTIHAFRASEGLPRILVRYEDLMAAPVETVAQLIARLEDLGVAGLRVPTEREITAFISPDLHRQHRSPDARRLAMNEQQLALAAAVDDGSILDADVIPPQPSEGALEALRMFEEYRARQARIEDLAQQVENVTNDRAQQIADLTRDFEQQIGALNRDFEVQLAAVTLDFDRRARAASSALDDIQERVRSVNQSRTWRTATRLAAVRRRLTPGASSSAARALDRVIAEVKQTRKDLEPRDADSSEPPSGDSATAGHESSSTHPGTRRRPKVAVLAWDVGHNPLGRAHVLAGVLQRTFDVEIWGAQFPRYGSDVWAPLRDSKIPIHVFEGRSLPEHLEIMQEVATRIDADALYVSKPRLPSFGLGILAKEARNRPLVLDVDDDELAFFGEGEGIDPLQLFDRRGDASLTLPFDRLWTQACAGLIGATDRLTVSNVALEERYGGVIVPHARDERLFDPARYDRRETRRRIGVPDSTRLLLFGGTPRVHKGIVDVLRALDRLADDRYRVLLFGTRELNELRSDIGDLERWVVALPYQRFEDLPALVGAADLACVLQDPSHPVAQYQLPAKITDALAMGVPCLVRPVPPLRSLVDQGVLQVLEDGEPLHERIAEVFDHYDDALERAQKGRRTFEDEYSYEAVSKVVAPMFDQLLEGTPRLSTRLATLTEVGRRLFGGDLESTQRPLRVHGRPGRPIDADGQYDIVVFWKQNDTGIYGRRQDMFVKYLAQSGRVRSIVHFDKPTTPEQLYQDYRRSRRNTDQTQLVLRQTVRRVLRRSDTERIHYYTFVHSGPTTGRLGLRGRARYADYVRAALDRHGFGDRPTILWAFPTNEDLPELIDALDPDIVVTDVVDDHRTFAAEGSLRYAGFERNYREVLARSDVVLANCEPVAEGMREFAPAVHVIPNGLELRNGARRTARPSELQDLTGPIIGYVGNLSQRLDVDLLAALVDARPGWQFVFVGSAHHDRSILRLESEPNVHFVGVKPYEETLRFIEHFDVALIPHLDNEMTRSMNPLKAFVYCSTGVPVVSTPVANLGDLASMITIARGPDEFVTAIERALATGRGEPDLDVLRPHSWPQRIEQALDIIDDMVGSQSRR